jgi:ubiquinone/menaquinone biosynthesis C-methylase UbiE
MSKKKINRADYYDEGEHNYLKYWDGRDYEHAAEEIMIRRLLHGKHFNHAVDVGGGYGRLSVVLKDYADKVTLAEPSKKQLDIAKDYLKGKPKVHTAKVQAEKLPFSNGEIDFVMIVRVIHHLPNPMPAFEEIHRILEKEGYFLLEFANYANFKNRVKHAAKLKKMPVKPVDIRTEATKDEGDVPFVNHNPKTVERQLAQVGFKIEERLSVSNFRSPRLKKMLGKNTLVKLEKIAQKPLANTYFGPSTVLLLKKM